ncbi:hypothetical protein [Streptomyces sp. NPDC050564]|uniref:hypothetical protein n=1 Tax=Streptomyces sp. NPDC050564 TaxID=3365631 RepID=UPI0037BDB5DA
MGSSLSRRERRARAARKAQRRAGQQRKSRRWWRRIPWKKWGTAAGVLGAIGTLAFTGVATYYQASVSKDQLKQSKADTKRAIRNQGMHITYWTDRGPDGSQNFHVMNSSPDPVINVIVSFAVAIVPEKPDSQPRKGESLPAFMFEADLPGLAPCSALVFTAGMLTYRDAHGRNRVRPPDNWPLFGRGIQFTDSAGQTWLRSGGDLSLHDPRDAEWRQSVPPDSFGEVKGVPKQERPASCSSS